MEGNSINKNREEQKKQIKSMLSDSKNQYIRNTINRLMYPNKNKKKDNRSLNEEKKDDVVNEEMLNEFYANSLDDVFVKFSSILPQLIKHLYGLAYNGMIGLTNNNKHWYDEIIGKFINPFINIKLKGNDTVDKKLNTFARAINTVTNNLDINTLYNLANEFYAKENYDVHEYYLEQTTKSIIDILKELPENLASNDKNQIEQDILNLIKNVGFYEGEN